jgi:hypothetical protein
MKEFFKQIFTDAKLRPEIKNILGIPPVVVGFVLGVVRLCGLFAFTFADWAIFMGIAISLLFATAAADAAIDKAEK